MTKNDIYLKILRLNNQVELLRNNIEFFNKVCNSAVVINEKYQDILNDVKERNRAIFSAYEEIQKNDIDWDIVTGKLQNKSYKILKIVFDAKNGEYIALNLLFGDFLKNNKDLSILMKF